MKLKKQDLVGKKIDIHTHCTGVMLDHLINQKYPIAQDINDLSNIVIGNGIDYAITFPIPLSIYFDHIKFHNEKRLCPSNMTDFPFQAENLTMLYSISKFNLTHLLPFLSVSTRDKVNEQISFIRDMLQQYPIYGLKYHSSMDLCAANEKSFEPFANLAMECDLPILFHTKMDNYANPMNLLDFAKKYPEIRICAAHLAQLYKPFYEELHSDIHYQNVFIDCAPLSRNHFAMSAMNPNEHLIFSNPVCLIKELSNENPGRILWGSDAPWNRYVNDQNRVVEYPDDVTLVDKSGLWPKFSQNSINFLFGIPR